MVHAHLVPPQKQYGAIAVTKRKKFRVGGTGPKRRGVRGSTTSGKKSRGLDGSAVERLVKGYTIVGSILARM